MTDQGFDRLQELETENQCLLRELEEKNQRLRELDIVTTETLSEAGEQVLENKAGTFLVNPKGIQDDILLHDIIGFGEKYLPGYH